MTKQEYTFIRNLAWDLLIDSKTSHLPVDIKSVAAIYNLQNLINNSMSLYENTLLISEEILKIFGLTTNLSKYLAIRILSPMIILRELNIASAEEVCVLSRLPMNLAIQRYERLKMLMLRDSFEISSLETMVLFQFQEWIKEYKSQV